MRSMWLIIDDGPMDTEPYGWDAIDGDYEPLDAGLEEYGDDPEDTYQGQHRAEG